MTTRIIPGSIDFTDRDFDSLKLRLQALARSVFPDWTEFNVANFGNILLELFCYVGDILHFYQDNQAGECFIPTLTQRVSMIRLGQLIGFTMPTAAAATGDPVFTVSRVNPTSALNIGRGTRIRTVDPESPVDFQTTESGTIPAGGSSVIIPCEQSQRQYESYLSTGEPNQEVILTNTPFLDGSLDSCTWDGTTLWSGLSAVNGDYTRVDSFLGYSATDRVFVVLVDHLDRAHVRFGNGAVGAIPQGEVKIAYKTGGGVNGNVEAGKLSVIEDALTFDDGSTADVSVTNPTATSGGADRMSLDEAIARAPASLRILTRTVSRADFETVATGVRGVARALLATSNEYAGIIENTGRLYVVAQGSRLPSGNIEPATPSNSMLQQISDAIYTDKPPTVTFTFTALPAVFKTVTVRARIYVKRGYTGTEVASRISSALRDFFAVQLASGAINAKIDFGANLVEQDSNWQSVYSPGTLSPTPELVWSDVFDIVRDIEGVRKVSEGQDGFLLNGLRSSVALTPIEFPRLGSVVIVDADTDSILTS